MYSSYLYHVTKFMLIILIQKNSEYSPRDELEELEKVGRGPALVLRKTWEGHKIEGEGCSATNIMLSSLLLANTGIPSLTLLSNSCSSSVSVSHGLHIVANGYEATKTKLLTTYLLLHQPNK